MGLPIFCKLLGVLPYKALEEIAQIERHVWIGILLNDKGTGRALREDR